MRSCIDSEHCSKQEIIEKVDIKPFIDNQHAAFVVFSLHCDFLLHLVRPHVRVEDEVNHSLLDCVCAFASSYHQSLILLLQLVDGGFPLDFRLLMSDEPGSVLVDPLVQVESV